MRVEFNERRHAVFCGKMSQKRIAHTHAADRDIRLRHKAQEPQLARAQPLALKRCAAHG